jgi:hypothetical protein
MTFTPIDTGSPKIFQNGTERRKASRIFGDMKAYFFVDEIAMYKHEFLTLCIDIYLCHPDSHIDR